MSDCIMTGEELARRCADIAANRKTIYMYACYGFQVTDAAIRSKSAQNLNGWYTSARIAHLKEKANQTPPVWGFDCVNLIKGILWGWTGDETKEKGGAKYATNGVPDTNADGMIARCSDVSTDFREIAVGEAVWMKGHIGVYIGQGLCVECTPKWADGVQITAVWNIGIQRQDVDEAREAALDRLRGRRDASKRVEGRKGKDAAGKADASGLRSGQMGRGRGLRREDDGRRQPLSGGAGPSGHGDGG